MALALLGLKNLQWSLLSPHLVFFSMRSEAGSYSG
jgi:hypothetical protein